MKAQPPPRNLCGNLQIVQHPQTMGTGSEAPRLVVSLSRHHHPQLVYRTLIFVMGLWTNWRTETSLQTIQSLTWAVMVYVRTNAILFYCACWTHVLTPHFSTLCYLSMSVYRSLASVTSADTDSKHVCQIYSPRMLSVKADHIPIRPFGFTSVSSCNWSEPRLLPDTVSGM